MHLEAVRNWKKSSFLFGSTDMYTTYGIQLTQDSIPQDVLLPGLREANHPGGRRQGDGRILVLQKDLCRSEARMTRAFIVYGSGMHTTDQTEA